MIHGKELNIIQVGRDKEIIDSRKAFIRELELTKHRLEIKPRKVNMMQSQEEMIKDVIAVHQKRKMYIPNSKGGFV